MTDRPVYTFTVTNRSAGWTYTATQGDDSTLDDDVQLADPLTMGWAFTDEQFGPSFDPDQMTFVLLAKTARHLPPIAAGDVIYAQLDRPRTAGPAYAWMRFIGRASEPVATPRGKRMQLTITANGWDSMDPPITATAVWPALEGLRDVRVPRIAAAAGVNVDASLVVNDGIIGPVTPDGVSTIDLLRQVAVASRAGSLVAGDAGYVRAGRHDPSTTFASGTLGNFQNDLDNPDVGYVFGAYSAAGLSLSTPRPYRLVRAGGTLDLQFLGASPADGRQLDARHVEKDVTYRKDRSAANWLEVRGTPDGTDTITPVGRAANMSSVAAQGRIIAELETMLSYAPTCADVARQYLRLAGVNDEWNAEDVSVQTKRMNDAELDAAALEFWPRWNKSLGDAGGSSNATSSFPKRLVLLNTDDDWQLTGSVFVASIVGCTFTVAGGELTITPQLRALPHDLAKEANAVTSSQIAASPTLSAATVNDFSGTGITFTDLAFTTL